MLRGRETSKVLTITAKEGVQGSVEIASGASSSSRGGNVETGQVTEHL